MTVELNRPLEHLLDAPVEDVCNWWVGQGADLNSLLWKIKRRVEEYVRDQTVVTTPNGTLEAQSAGWDWDTTGIAAELPELVSAMRVAFTGSQNDCERALSLVTEECPSLSFEISREIDKRQAGKFANAGGELGDKLRAMRVAKPAKVVAIQR